MIDPLDADSKTPVAVRRAVWRLALLAFLAGVWVGAVGGVLWFLAGGAP